MARFQCSNAIRDGRNNSTEAILGAGSKFYIYTGTMPDDCATADTGARIASGTLPTDCFAASSAGSMPYNSPWTVTGLAAAGGGTQATYYRIVDAGDVVHFQAPIGPNASPTQAGTWSAGNASVTLSAPNTAIVRGMSVAGTGIQADTYVAAIADTALTLSRVPLVAGTGATLTFSTDMVINNTSIAYTQSVPITAFTLIAGNG